MSTTLSSQAAVLAAFGRASTITLGAYTLRAAGSVASALERAADRGARVAVTLEGVPHFPGAAGGIDRANRRVASELRDHGVDVRLAGPADERLHLKAAIVDGKQAFLDDRNWPSDGCDTIVATTDRGTIGALTSALAGKPVSHGAFATEKAPALRLEADAIGRARGRDLDIATESFGASAVSKAIRERVAAGTRVRLLVSAPAYASATPRERAGLASLAAAGVDVRLGRSDEKLCIGSDRGWVGSANATYSPEPMLDWGYETGDRAMLGGLENAFARDWRMATPLATRSLSAISQDGIAGSR